MAHSRLEKIGTIYSRVTGLIRTGAMKLEDRPLWYDVYQAFPPITPPRYDTPASKEPIKSIFYPEDVIRAKLFKKLHNVPAVNLKDTKSRTVSQKFIEVYSEATTKGASPDEAFDQAFAQLKTFTPATRSPSDEKPKKSESFQSQRMKMDVSKVFDET